MRGLFSLLFFGIYDLVDIKVILGLSINSKQEKYGAINKNLKNGASSIEIVPLGPCSSQGIVPLKVNGDYICRIQQ